MGKWMRQLAADKNNFFVWILVLAIAPFLLGCDDKNAGDKPRVKRVVKIQPMEFRFIELEDGARYGMGENLYNRLVTRLQNSKEFIVIVDEDLGTSEVPEGALGLFSKKATSDPEYDPSDRLRFNFAPLPAASFSAELQGLTFSHGSKAIRNFSGFTRTYRNPWNSGDFESLNEFPPRSLDFQTSWFDNTFEPLGSEETGTIAGIDAGQEGEFNLIIASVYYKRDKFRASASLDTRLELFAENDVRAREIEASGKGFLFALGVTYQQLTVEFGIVKKDALKKTFDQAVDLMVEEITNTLRAIPFRTKIEEIGSEGIIISAGRREGLRVGDIFKHKTGNSVSTLRVSETFYIGSIVEVVNGSSNLQPSDVVVFDKGASDNAANQAMLAELPSWKRWYVNRKYKDRIQEEMSSESLPDNRRATQQFLADTLPNGARGLLGPVTANSIEGRSIIAEEKTRISFDPPEFSFAGGDAKKALNLKDSLLLPYHLYRWSLYDQEVDKEITFEPRQNILQKARLQKNMQMIHLASAWQNHFPAGGMGLGAKVAIIDTGIDYNHRNLAAAFDRNYVGFDYFGYDARPFDDNSHGTAIAGIIAAQGVRTESVGIAPDAQLLAYRVFNPYGETRSAQIYGAVEKAIFDGAQVIVLPWSTRKYSLAIEAAINFAGQANVLVVTAAGDRGEDLNEEAFYPAHYGTESHVITVANLNDAGNLSQTQGRFSNFGLGTVDIAAPGENISTLAPRNEYYARTGSDIAAAHVAGVAALLLTKNPNRSAADLKQAILNGATSVDKLRPFVGEGRVLNADGALYR